MSKLFNLKEWLTVPDTARHLSIVFGEEVTEADIYQFALAGKLTLSVDFPNGTYAREGRKVPFDEAERVELPPKDDGTPVFAVIGEYLAETGEIIQFGDKVRAINGAWDLCMMHNDRFDIEWLFYQKISDINRDAISLEGVIVKRGDVYCNLQEDFDDNEFQPGSTAQLEKLKRHIAENNIEGAEAESLLRQHKKERMKFQENKKSRPNSQNYYPAGGLPKDSVLVVRTEVLRQFETLVGNAANGGDASPTQGDLYSLPQPKGKWTDEKLRMLWNMSLEPGMNKTGLAAHFGVTRQAIDKPLKRAEDKFSSKSKGRAFGL